jgi:cytochrome c
MDSMKAVVVACALIAGSVLTGAAQADEKLAKSAGCMTCHGVDKKIIGPAFKDVAAKYRGDKKSEEVLFRNVKQGSKGVWGSIPMPPNAHVKDEDIRTLVRWTLMQK